MVVTYTGLGVCLGQTSAMKLSMMFPDVRIQKQQIRENPSHTFSKDDLQMIMGRDTKNNPKQVLNYKYDLYLLWCLIKIQNNPIMICTL